MPNDHHTNLRLPTDLLDRVDALVPVLAELPEYAAWRVSRAAVIRLALTRGLTALEQAHALGATRKRSKR